MQVREIWNGGSEFHVVAFNVRIKNVFKHWRNRVLMCTIYST